MNKTICVCGAGTMGSGIAQVAATAGFATIQFDVSNEMLDKSKALIEKNLQSLVLKQRLTPEEKEAIVDRVSFTSNLEDCKADVVIEAIIEQLEAKIELFKSIEAINSGAGILATNTSSLPVTAIASHLTNPSNFAGIHFFNPAPLMKLVEVVKGEKTSDETISFLCSLAKEMGKTPVVCNDAPGFIVNRVARHYYLEALRLIELGIADYEMIDKVLEASGFKMGPFKLMDLIGIDINYTVSNIVWNALEKPERLTPSIAQKAKVDAGELGRKTGKGFYSY